MQLTSDRHYALHQCDLQPQSISTEILQLKLAIGPSGADDFNLQLSSSHFDLSSTGRFGQNFDLAIFFVGSNHVLAAQVNSFVGACGQLKFLAHGQPNGFSP
jgi:hypothetical protein